MNRDSMPQVGDRSLAAGTSSPPYDDPAAAAARRRQAGTSAPCSLPRRERESGDGEWEQRRSREA